MDQPLRKTPLHSLHVQLGARMVPYAGWEMPIQYAGVKAEHLAVRQSAGVFDVSHMGELRVRGDAAIAAVNHLITNDLSRAPNGKGIYTCCCNAQGLILDDVIVYRLADDDVLVVCNAANLPKIRSHFERELASSSVTFEDESDATALLAFQGPAALGLLAPLCERDPRTSLRRFELTSMQVAGQPCRVARTGYTGEDGVEILCEPVAATSLFETLLALGTDAQPVVPAGLAARDTLRLEAALALYGNDIDETTNPFEAGLGWTVKLNKPDFIGKAALTKAQQRVERRLIGFEVTGRGIARAGYPLLDASGNVIGRCTSGAPAPWLGNNIGLGYVPTASSDVGTKLLVDCRGRHVEAQVAPTPFYRRPTTPQTATPSSK